MIEWELTFLQSACVFHRLSSMRRTHRNAEFERETGAQNPREGRNSSV